MKIFISYSSADRERIQPIIRELEARGYSVWWDRKIPPGRTFDEVIEEAIDAADCVLVIWSEKSVKSKWVRTEADEGERRGILIPILIDNVTIPLAFRRIEAANLVGWRGGSGPSEWDILLESLERLAGMRPAPAATPSLPQKASVKRPENKKMESQPPAMKEGALTFDVSRMFWLSANRAQLTISKDGLVFQDLQDPSYSYRLSVEELKRATFSFNQLFDEGIITTSSGRKYQFGTRTRQYYDTIIKAINDLINPH